MFAEHMEWTLEPERLNVEAMLKIAREQHLQAVKVEEEHSFEEPTRRRNHQQALYRLRCLDRSEKVSRKHGVVFSGIKESIKDLHDMDSGNGILHIFLFNFIIKIYINYSSFLIGPISSFREIIERLQQILPDLEEKARYANAEKTRQRRLYYIDERRFSRARKNFDRIHDPLIEDVCNKFHRVHDLKKKLEDNIELSKRVQTVKEICDELENM